MQGYSQRSPAFETYYISKMSYSCSNLFIISLLPPDKYGRSSIGERKLVVANDLVGILSQRRICSELHAKARKAEKVLNCMAHNI